MSGDVFTVYKDERRVMVMVMVIFSSFIKTFVFCGTKSQIKAKLTARMRSFDLLLMGLPSFRKSSFSNVSIEGIEGMKRLL